MARSSSNAPEDGAKVNLRLPEGFLADLDETWQAEGYGSRSEFMREALRNAVYGPRLSKKALADLLVSERQFAADNTVTVEEARARFGADRDGGTE